jgi:hypothetical protein
MPMTSIQKRHEFPKGELRIVAPDDAGRWISIENACISGIEGEPQCVVALGSTYHCSIRVARRFTLLFGNRQARFVIVQFRADDA